MNIFEASAGVSAADLRMFIQYLAISLACMFLMLVMRGGLAKWRKGEIEFLDLFFDTLIAVCAVVFIDYLVV